MNEEFYCNICEKNTKHIEFICPKCQNPITVCLECGVDDE